MILYLIPAAVIVVSLLAIMFIVFKNFSSIAAVNVESIAREKESKLRNKILLQRLSRHAIELKNKTKTIISPILDVAGKAFDDLYKKALELEKSQVKQQQPLKQIDINQEVKDKITEVRRLMMEREFIQAEEMAIEVVGLDSKNLDAYEALVGIYIENKDYKKARETAKFLIKLLGTGKKDTDDKHRIANAYAELGWVYELERKPAQAIKSYQKATNLEPSNPRFLDLLLKISIILGNKPLAEEVFESLRQSDPDNQKLPEIRAEIDAIVETVETTPQQ